MDLLQDFEAYFLSLGLLDNYVCSFDGAKDSPDALIVLTEYGGGTILSQIDGVARSVQILVRDLPDNTVKAKQKANQLFASLKTEDAIVELTTPRWGVVTLRQTPFKVKVDNVGRVYYGFNLGIITYHD